MTTSGGPAGQGGFLAGQNVGAGRYTLIQFLGRGGMGVVWLARDDRLREEVALKFLLPEIAHDPAALEDMRRETLKSRRLSHPNIVRIHDLFEAPGEAPFISMEYIDGRPLSALRMVQPKQFFTWEYLQPLVVQLCEALDYAHSQKVIHRDLKPGNMMIEKGGRLKLADFGIAATAADSLSRLTRDLGSSGTPAYMSPQQMCSHPPKIADDIYALGATLYELLSSKPPFYTGDIFRQVLDVPPLPLPERLAAFELTNNMPDEVASTVLACLSKDATQRPPGAMAVAEWMLLDSGSPSQLGRRRYQEPKTASQVAIVPAPASTATPTADELDLGMTAGGVPTPSLPAPEAPAEPAAEWAEPYVEPEPEKRTGLWIGVSVGAALFSLTLALLIWAPWKKSAASAPVVSPSRATGPASTVLATPAEPAPSLLEAGLPTPNASSWLPMLNGKDLAGWIKSDYGGAWKVSGFTLSANYGAAGSIRALRSVDMHASFQCRFATRFSGVKPPNASRTLLTFMLWDRNDVTAEGAYYQVTIRGDQKVKLHKFVGKGSNKRQLLDLDSGSRINVRTTQGKDVVNVVPDFPYANTNVPFIPENWTSWFITASNSTITVSCENRPVLQLIDESQFTSQEGFITLHIGTAVVPNAQLEIKDFHIRPLERLAALAPSPALPPADTPKK